MLFRNNFVRETCKQRTACAYTFAQRSKSTLSYQNYEQIRQNLGPQFQYITVKKIKRIDKIFDKKV